MRFSPAPNSRRRVVSDWLLAIFVSSAGTASRRDYAIVDESFVSLYWRSSHSSTFVRPHRQCDRHIVPKLANLLQLAQLAFSERRTVGAQRRIAVFLNDCSPAPRVAITAYLGRKV